MKRTMTTIAIIWMLFILPTAALAQRISGGGNLVFCDPGLGFRSLTYTLLDYYDAKKKNGYGFTLDLGPGLSADDKIKFVLDRLEKVDPFRANIYREFAAKFESERVNSEFAHWATPSHDLGNGYILPPGCEIKRAAILRSNEELVLLNDDRPYEISKLWDEFDETTKAGLKLHEIAYREAIFRGATDSLAIRRYVALISSRDVLTIDYQLEILKSGLQYWGHQKTGPTNSLDPNPKETPLFPDSSTYMIGITQEMSSELILSLISGNGLGYESIHIEGQTKRCRNIQIRGAKNKLITIEIYKKLVSPKGLKFSELPPYMSLALNKCGNIHYTSDMFPQTNLKFDFIGEEKATWWDSGYRHDELNVYVKQGTAEGTDISGKKCKIRLKTMPNRDYLKTPAVLCEDHSNKSW